MPKVVIVGAGSAGTTIAYTLQITGVATEILLLDSNHELAEGQVLCYFLKPPENLNMPDIWRIDAFRYQNS